MTYPLPPLNWLRAFEAAARHTSFTAAATELGLTPAAVSHQVRSLEKDLGFALFERLPRSLQLTDMGRAYLPSVRKAFDELSASTAGLFGPMGGQAVTVRAPITTAVLWLGPRLTSFKAAYPEIDVRLASTLWADALTPEDIDIDIRLGHGRWPGFEAELLWNESAVPLCSPAYYTDQGKPKTLAALAGLDLIHITGYEDFWMRLFHAGQVEGPSAQRGFRVDTSLAALEMAAAGLGCTMVLGSFARRDLETGRLVRPLEIDLPLDQSHYFVMPDDGRRLRPEALLFRDWLFDEARQGAEML